MPKYPPNGNTRVAVAPAVSNLAAPTLAEITAGTDITCDLTQSGLHLNISTEGEDRTPWRGPMVVTAPTRFRFDNPYLEGFHFTQPEEQVLWDLAVLRDRYFLIVRRGVPYDTAWTAGQAVEVIDFRFGQRSSADPSAEVPSTFTVPLFVSDYDGAAVIAA